MLTRHQRFEAFSVRVCLILISLAINVSFITRYCQIAIIVIANHNRVSKRPIETDNQVTL